MARHRHPYRPHRTALALAAFFAGLAAARAAPEPKDDLARARALDHAGVKAYTEGRYHDAIRYFQESHRLGGPPDELWNVAKCQVRLDEPEAASETIERYLSQPGLTAGDRAEASRQLRELRGRRSTLTITSAPPGAAVLVDGRRPEPGATTPFSVDVAPGSHTLTLEAPGYRSYTKHVDAHFGRAIIVDAPLERASDTTPHGGGKPPPHPPPEEEPVPARFAADAQFVLFFSKLGAVGEPAHAGAMLRATYAFVATPKVSLSVGARGVVTGDAWSNSEGPMAAPGCTLPDHETATELGLGAVAALAFRPTRALRLGFDTGAGAAFYFADQVGGDVFVPTCRASFGAKPVFHAGLEAALAVTPAFHVGLSPLVLDLHPAFDGAREQPKDAAGLWVRVGFGVGLGIDL
jgi:hypothetical protein